MLLRGHWRERVNGGCVASDVVIAHRLDYRTRASLIQRVAAVRDHAIADRQYGPTQIVESFAVERDIAAFYSAARHRDS